MCGGMSFNLLPCLHSLTAPSQLGYRANAAIGFATGVLAAFVTEPIDVIRTRLMTQVVSYFILLFVLYGMVLCCVATGVRDGADCRETHHAGCIVLYCIVLHRIVWV